ncbi:YbjN domain-containing protein [Glycocaulis abyssi]|uniref:YbjN domain-containing protein n=1 Tax=Glycocaulis abyssi TaxID=1433403 RepID=A0ABV9NEP7_9PROT
MMDLHTETYIQTIDPLESVEQAVIAEQYAYERDDTELHMAVPGEWRDHQVWFAWRPELDVLHVCASLELKTPPARFREVCELVTRLNERLWLGHFDVWAEDGSVVFRHALSLAGGETVSPAQAAALIVAAREAGERLYPAFHYLVWGGKSVEEAVAAAMFDTAGEA